jgi:hypothetical protein
MAGFVTSTGSYGPYAETDVVYHLVQLTDLVIRYEGTAGIIRMFTEIDRFREPLMEICRSLTMPEQEKRQAIRALLGLR